MDKRAKLITWIVSFQAVGAIIGWSMKGSLDGWYQALEKSPLTPPGYVFSFVWPTLYTLLATAGWMLWDAKSNKQLEKIKSVYIVQMIANWSWTPLFFGLHMIEVSMGVIVLMIALTMYMVVELYEKKQMIATLLAPYLVWISFALYLNYYTWLHN